MPAPTTRPADRDPATVAPTDSYQPSDPVWAFCGNTWCAGVIEYVSDRAATVTYRPGTSRGTGVNTLTADHLMRRDDVDPALDRAAHPTERRSGQIDQR